MSAKVQDQAPVSLWMNQLERLASEWERTQKQEIERWEQWIAMVREEARELRAAGKWVGGPTDFMSVIGRSRFELDHSAMIGWLLDPCMHHGFGTRLLGGLLDRCFPGEDFGGLESARIEREVAREDCRADIVIWGEAFSLIIENKVDALEGEDQCLAYYRHFGDSVGSRFLFLTPSGRPPTSAGEVSDAFVPLSYIQMGSILESTLEATVMSSPGRARHIAESYLQTLRKEFS